MRFLLCFISFLCIINCGELINFNFAGRTNRLYVPSKPSPKPGLFVMLHGCTQNPDDFARGTDMGKYADERGFYALFLIQTTTHNMNKCWNWFLPEHQKRGAGEPGFISGATIAIVKQYGIDPSQVSVSGISAGGAMSIIMGVTYPDLFCCVGSAAGLEFKAATSSMSAFTAMSMGGPAPSTQGKLAFTAMKPHWKGPIQTVVFQGTSDFTVQKINGEQSTLQWVIANDQGLAPGDNIKTTPTSTSSCQVPGGRAYTVNTYDAVQLGAEVVTYVTVTAMAHAWSGGSSSGTYTDPKGPSMTKLIVDTFLNWGSSRGPNRTMIKKLDACIH
jgi:poly(hydroxyalkanoate) depolymerase family esterase